MRTLAGVTLSHGKGTLLLGVWRRILAFVLASSFPYAFLCVYNSADYTKQSTLTSFSCVTNLADQRIIFLARTVYFRIPQLFVGLWYLFGDDAFMRATLLSGFILGGGWSTLFLFESGDNGGLLKLGNGLENRGILRWEGGGVGDGRRTGEIGESQKMSFGPLRPIGIENSDWV